MNRRIGDQGETSGRYGPSDARSGGGVLRPDFNGGGGTPVKTVDNTTSVGTVGDFTNQDINGLIAGSGWNTTSLTYSFPTSATDYGAGYSDQSAVSGFQPLIATQQAVVRYAFDLISQYTLLNFTEITETPDTHATLRYAGSSAPPTSYAYYPGTSDTAGDAFYGNIRDTDPMKAGYEFDTILHEIGHNMGLKHGQDDDGVHGVLPTNHDSTSWSLMDYHSYIGADSFYRNVEGSGNTTYMVDDIAALQYIYGANFATQASDTVYSWSPTTGEEFINGVGQGAAVTNTVYMALWDGNGHDTYDFSHYTTDFTIDLRPGEWSTFSSDQLAYLNSADLSIRAPGNVCNANLYNGDTRSLIENLRLGSGNGVATGNAADNTFYAGSGATVTLNGLDGNDTFFMNGNLNATDQIDGGAGFDRVTLTGDYSAGLVFGASTLINVEALSVRVGFNYKLTTNDATVAAGQNLLVNASSLGAANTLTFDGSAETDGTFSLYGGAGGDSFVMGAHFVATDHIDGGGGLDRLTLAGDYSAGLTFGASTLINVELLSLRAGFNYKLTTNNATVAGGQNLLVNASSLGAANTLTFDGSAETDGTFSLYGGAGGDSFVMGAHFVATDHIDGGGGADRVTLAGDYSTGLTLGASTMINVEVLSLRAGFTYKLTTNNATVAAGQTLTVNASSLGAANALTFDGSAETNGAFSLSGGAGGDTLIGGAGADTLIGGAGADTLVGKGGANVFLYKRFTDSTAAAADTLTDWHTGDKIDLAAVDADTSLAGVQKFHLGATAGHVGDIVIAYDAVNDRTSIDLYDSASGTPGGRIWLSGNHADLTRADFNGVGPPPPALAHTIARSAQHFVAAMASVGGGAAALHTSMTLHPAASAGYTLGDAHSHRTLSPRPYA